MTEDQPASASRPPTVAALEHLNLDAAKEVYRERLAKNEIRLIKIHPGEEPDAIRCSTFIVPKQEQPEYEALSYVWGTRANPKTILLQGVTWHVTQNLYHALLRLRLADRFRVIWIDALAINQTDLTERNEQVKQMSGIYASAKSTLVWLGEATYDSIANAFDLLKLYSDLPEVGRHQWRVALVPKDTRFKIWLVSMMNSVFRLEYWQRIWVVQEILFSQQILLMYSQHTLAYSEFFACMGEICSFLASPPQSLAYLPQRLIDPEVSSLLALAHSTKLMVSDAIPTCGAARDGKYMSLREWSMAQLKRSMDRRDKVFGYYGCFHPSIRNQIQVDYSKTLPELMNLMMRLLLQEEGLSMLFGPRMGYDPTYGIPSWVWSLMEPASVTTRGIGTVDDILDKDPGNWCAGGPLTSVMNFSDDGMVLHVKGKVAATIETTAPSSCSPPQGHLNDFFFLDKPSTNSSFETLVEHFRLAWQSFDLSPEFPSTLGFITAFWLQPRGPILSELASWLGTRNNESLEIIRTEYIPQLVDNLLSIHFHRRMFFFMPMTMEPSTDPVMRNIQGQIHGESGLGPGDTAPGDKICVLRGCSVPVVLRQEGDRYTLLGEAYVPLLMYGEAVDGLRGDEYEDFWIK